MILGFSSEIIFAVSLRFDFLKSKGLLFNYDGFFERSSEDCRARHSLGNYGDRRIYNL
jgi:hypothetical protein